MFLNHAERLTAAIINAGVPITNLTIGQVGVSASVIVAPTNLQGAAQPTINTFDWSQTAQDAFDNLKARTTADNLLDLDKTALLKIARAQAAVAVDEINILREWTVSFKAAVAAATSLANLQTRVAALPDLSDRTLAQFKTAIKNKINAGTVD